MKLSALAKSLAWRQADRQSTKAIALCLDPAGFRRFGGPCCRSWRRSFRERVWIRTDRLASSTLVPLARFQGKTPGRPKVRQDQSHSRPRDIRSEEHTLNSSHGSISYAVFCLKK